jgi:hypothetical protein
MTQLSSTNSCTKSKGLLPSLHAVINLNLGSLSRYLDLLDHCDLNVHQRHVLLRALFDLYLDSLCAVFAPTGPTYQGPKTPGRRPILRYLEEEGKPANLRRPNTKNDAHTHCVYSATSYSLLRT